jgi:L-2,4-diaminobutyric acid acetyltransferase
MWRLVQATGTLESNSPYLYLLMASDFGGTCLLAEQDSEPVGFVMGYRPPREPEAAFVWQVGVLPTQRGQGLGLQMLETWLALPANQDAQWLTATVDAANTASQALFRRLAKTRNTQVLIEPRFTTDQFPVEHPAEPLMRIGPLRHPA